MTYDWIIFMASGAVFGVGLGIVLSWYAFGRQLTGSIQRMRYDGFRPQFPPERPKTVPVPELQAPWQEVRED